MMKMSVEIKFKEKDENSTPKNHLNHNQAEFYKGIERTMLNV